MNRHKLNCTEECFPFYTDLLLFSLISFKNIYEKSLENSNFFSERR